MHYFLNKSLTFFNQYYLLRKVNEYSPSEAASVYEKAITRKNIAVFSPDSVINELKYLKVDTELPDSMKLSQDFHKVIWLCAFWFRSTYFLVLWNAAMPPRRSTWYRRSCNRIMSTILWCILAFVPNPGFFQWYLSTDLFIVIDLQN